MSTTSDKSDHGTFGLRVPQESVLLVQLAEAAQNNPQQPGHAWARVPGTRTIEGHTEEGVKIYHLDLTANRLTMTEEWAGQETARKTFALEAKGGDGSSPPHKGTRDVPSGPTAPPDPGPPTPTFHRLPFRSADLLPESDLREWLLERADLDVSNLSVLPRRIRLFGEGFQEVVALPQALAANVAPGTGATLRALSGRPGVERRFVEGWFGSVDGRGTAWILEAGEGQDWWLAMRTFDRRPGLIGRWTSAWTQRAGTGVDAVSPSLRVVVAPPPDEKPIPVGQPKPPAQPQLAMTGGSLKPAEEVPATAEAVANRVGREWEALMPLGKGPDGHRLTVFRGHEWETWVLEGEFPMGLDDMIRAISARGEVPTSLAVARMGVLAFEGDAYRAVITEGEAQGRRWTRALLIGLAPDGTVLGHRLVMRDHGEVADDGWIGVPPISDISLFTLGSAEA